MKGGNFVRTTPLGIFVVHCLLFTLPFCLITSLPPQFQTAACAAGMEVFPSSCPPLFRFGSQPILEGCWSQQELTGSWTEKYPGSSFGGQSIETQRKSSREAPGEPLPVELRGSIRSVKIQGDEKAVALTFDLCEGSAEKSGYDERIFDYLRGASVPATLFAGGKWMQSHPERTMQLMADPLFEIANHSWSHANFRLISTQEMERQVVQTQVQYELLREALSARPCASKAGPLELEHIPHAPLLFRFPYGTCNPEALNLLRRLGLPAIQWDVVTGDPARGQTPEALARSVLHQTRPGSIIIAHANGRGHATAAALPLFIPKLRAQGYRFVSVSELLRLGKPVIVDECYEQTRLDNARYDRNSSGSRKSSGAIPRAGR